jgi:hypothetical protein
MDVDRAIEIAIAACTFKDAWASGYRRPDEGDKEAIPVLESLRARLRREREAIEAMYNDLERITEVEPSDMWPAPQRVEPEDINAWMAMLRAILRGEGTT